MLRNTLGNACLVLVLAWTATAVAEVPFGHADWRASPTNAVGFAGQGNNWYPGATPPLEWSDTTNGPAKNILWKVPHPGWTDAHRRACSGYHPGSEGGSVDVLDLQVGANGLDNLARVCKGRVCVDLDLNRQMFPFWKPADIDRHVREAVQTMGAPEGGLWLKAEIAEDVPLENVEAIFCALEKYREYAW